MLSVDTRAVPSPLGPMANTVKGQLHELMNTGNYYVTPEMTRELTHINHGVEHVKLDHDFLTSSQEWGRKCNPQQTANEREGAAQAMHHAAQTVHNLRGEMEARSINSKQDNQVRQKHHTTMNALKQSEDVLAPYANQSIDRIKQYCDHVGVTDRFTGYKNNLNRGTRDPVQLGYKWLDGDKRNAGFRSARSVSMSDPCYGATDPRMALSARGHARRMTPMMFNSIQKAVPAARTSIPEQCGINTIFPGESEFMARYKRPPTEKVTVPFTVNPIPNTGAHGRPQASVAWEPAVTEFQWRYQWPDSTKIDKLPWIKKF